MAQRLWGAAFEQKQVKTHLGLNKFWSQDISRRGFTNNTNTNNKASILSHCIGTMGL